MGYNTNYELTWEDSEVEQAYERIEKYIRKHDDIKDAVGVDGCSGQKCK